MQKSSRWSARAAATVLLAVAFAAGGGVAANAATASPNVVGSPEWADFGTNKSACLSTQSLYQSEGAHIIEPCFDDDAGFLEWSGGIQPDWEFEYQWT